MSYTELRHQLVSDSQFKDHWGRVILEEKGQGRDVYDAVSDPTRRELLRLLANAGDLPLHELTAHFQMGRTAVSKHLAILKDAGLVIDRKVGRETRYQMNPVPLKQIHDWVAYYENFWKGKMVALNYLLQEEQRMTRTVALDFQFKSSIDKVWDALTDSDTLTKWVAQNDFKPIVGHKFEFVLNPTQNWVVSCEVLEVDKPHRLSYTWVGFGGESNTVTWTLKQIADGTVDLHLEQSGISEGADQVYNGAIYGWQRMAKKLENVLEER